MSKYLSSDVDLKNDYYLADIITKTCFVHGSKTFFKQFANGAKSCLDQNSAADTIDDIPKQVKIDMD